MGLNTIGLEIGSGTIKMAVSSGGKIKKMAVKRMPDDLVRDGRAISPDALSSFLTDMRKEFGIPSGNCSFVIPQQFVIAHPITMPAMSDDKVRMNLPYEFKDYVGEDGSKYDYDYMVQNVENGVMELFAAAVRRDIVEEYYGILKKAGLKLRVAIPYEMALSNLVDRMPDLDKPICIVDLGQNFTHVSIFVNRNYAMGRNIEIGGDLIDSTIKSSREVDIHVARQWKEADSNNALSSPECVDAYQTIAFEVMKVVNFFGYSAAEDLDPLEDLYYCGNTSIIEPLRNALTKATGMTLHHISHLVPGGIHDDVTLTCSLAAGAALQGRK